MGAFRVQTVGSWQLLAALVVIPHFVLYYAPGHWQWVVCHNTVTLKRAVTEIDYLLCALGIGGA
jgi:hypothetical protein